MKKLLAFLLVVMLSCLTLIRALSETMERYTIGSITYSVPSTWKFLGEPDEETQVLQYGSDPPTGVIFIMSMGDDGLTSVHWDMSLILDKITEGNSELYPGIEKQDEEMLPKYHLALPFEYIAYNEYPAKGILIDCNDGKMIMLYCFFANGDTKARDSVFESLIASLMFSSDEYYPPKEPTSSPKGFNIYSTPFNGLAFSNFLYDRWNSVDNASISGRVKNNNSYSVDGYFYILFYKNNMLVKSVLAALPLEGLPAGETGSWSTLIEAVNYDRVEYSDSTVYRAD